MYYALGEDPVNAPAAGYSENVIKKTDAGVYYIWYKVKGDGNHIDTAPIKLTAVISKCSISPSVSIEGWEYKETPKQPVVSGNSG